MLQPTPYPESYPVPKKLSVLQKQAKALGREDNFYRPPQTTFFHNGCNSAGVQMNASTGSGQDCTGVNDGSKVVTPRLCVNFSKDTDHLAQLEFGIGHIYCRCLELGRGNLL